MTNTRTKQEERTLYIILAAALAARLLLALVTEGYTYDMSCFVAWGDKLASEGPAAFYSADYFADYPPGYILVLGLVSLVRKALQLSYESRWTYFLLALIPAICDCAAVVLLDHISRRYMGQGRAQRCLVLFAAFCPLTLFDTGIWKQIDGAFALPLLLCFWLLEERRYLLAAVLYGVALAIKPQALLAGPVLAVCFLVAIADAVRDGKSPLKSVGQIFCGAALALLPPLLAGLPFYGAKNLVPSLIDKYITTASGYQYATINAFNWFAALGGNWQALDACPVFNLSWKVLGIFNIAVITVLLVVLAVISWRAGRFSPLLLAAFYTVGIFTFAHCMHERYLVLGMLLVLLAAARWNDIRLYGAGFGLSITGFLNLETVYTLVGSDDEWLSSDTSREFAMAVGFAETAAFVLLAFTAWAICRHGAISPLAKVETIEKDKTKTVQKKLELCTLRIDPQPAWTAKEKKALATLTLIVAVVSFAYLGSMKAPQNPVDATDSTATIDFTPQQDAVEIWVYPGISTGGSLRITDAAGNELYQKELSYATPFCWTKTAITAPAGQTLTATIENAQMFELALRDATGALVPVTGGDALFDEQSEVPDTISQLNSMYFDEIYHGRTGYEMLHRMTAYETTHPPLGKDFIMLGIAIFGMTAFGWRCAGTLFGVMLVPLMWCFARRLTHKRWAGAMAGALIAAGFMRFSQSRIATIDIYGTFFILLGAYFWNDSLWLALCRNAVRRDAGAADVVLCPPSDPQTLGRGHGRCADCRWVHAIFPKPHCHNRYLRYVLYPVRRIFYGMVLPERAAKRRKRLAAAHGAGRRGIWAWVCIQVDRNLCRGRACGIVPGCAVCPLEAKTAGLLERIPDGCCGRCGVLHRCAVPDLSCILPALLVERPYLWFAGLVGLPNLHVLVPFHPESNPPV